jgi:hypothetical protein
MGVWYSHVILMSFALAETWLFHEAKLELVLLMR